MTHLGPLDDKPCPRCGKRHHQYSWPQKCLDEAERLDRKQVLADYADSLKSDEPLPEPLASSIKFYRDLTPNP